MTLYAAIHASTLAMVLKIQLGIAKKIHAAHNKFQIYNLPNGGEVDYFYQSEKLSEARRSLMLPHSKGEAESIAECFHVCTLAFHRLHEESLDENSTKWIAKIKELMNTDAFDGQSAPEGLWIKKAKTLTTDQKIELSRSVDELAHWFGERED